MNFGDDKIIKALVACVALIVTYLNPSIALIYFAMVLLFCNSN